MEWEQSYVYMYTCTGNTFMSISKIEELAVHFTDFLLCQFVLSYYITESLFAHAETQENFILIDAWLLLQS